ncbi:MAG: polysaccharide deacetylase family protein [Muribaculaceae bacterium]|nr:polysaccharide deacetylase family protein [Muribaculaceae bacterium]
MNILTFDIEEWYIEKAFYGARQKKYDEYDKYLGRILDLLDETNQKGTFFCVGKLGKDFPNIIKKIADRGNEIGCHSNEHMWLTKMSQQQMIQDTHDAIAALEDVTGQKVKGYRAPAFSIGENNKWVFEVLKENGIEYDASIFPAKRDFGGFNAFPTDSPIVIDYHGIHIKEFPICLTNIFGKSMAFSGGGYFRFFPYWYVKKELIKREYGICYFHIGDLLNNKGGIMSREDYERYFKETGTLSNRLKRYIKSNIGTAGALDKMSRLINEVNFVNLKQADKIIDWNTVRVITL